MRVTDKKHLNECYGGCYGIKNTEMLLASRRRSQADILRLFQFFQKKSTFHEKNNIFKKLLLLARVSPELFKSKTTSFRTPNTSLSLHTTCPGFWLFFRRKILVCNFAKKVQIKKNVAFGKVTIYFRVCTSR